MLPYWIQHEKIRRKETERMKVTTILCTHDPWHNKLMVELSICISKTHKQHMGTSKN